MIKHLNEKFGTTFSLFRHDEENLNKLFAGMETQVRKMYGEKLWERKVQRPAALRKRIKDETQYDLQSPKRKRLIARADAVYDRLTNPRRDPARGVTTSAQGRYMANPVPLASAEALYQSGQKEEASSVR